MSVFRRLHDRISTRLESPNGVHRALTVTARVRTGRAPYDLNVDETKGGVRVGIRVFDSSLRESESLASGSGRTFEEALRAAIEVAWDDLESDHTPDNEGAAWEALAELSE